MKASPLELKLLGSVEITYQDKPLEINRRIERAMLYFLAVERRPINRTTLIDMFWPDNDEIDHRRALRTALSRLRKRFPDHDLVVTEMDRVWLNEEEYKIDALTFADHFLSLHQILSAYQENHPIPTQIVKQIEEALDLWCGDSFISGDPLDAYTAFETWRQEWDRKLAYYRRFLMKRLAEHHQVAGDLERSLELFIQLGRMDLLNTELHLSALDIMIQLGLHQEIIEYCDLLERSFEREFNAPLPETILSKCQYAQIQLIEKEKQNKNDWPSALTMQLKLVGRQAELETLHKAFYQGGLVRIEGELGIGKTRLVQELFYTLIPQPCLFLAPTLDMEKSLPFSPIVHALRCHVPDDIWNQINPIWANILVYLLPELSQIRDDLEQVNYAKFPSGIQPLFDAIHHVLQTLAKRNGRILFFLDNAQWADKQTIQLLSYILSHGFFDEHGLLIIANRSEEVNDDLDLMINRFHRTQPVTTIRLTGLNPVELGALSAQLMETQPPVSLINQLFLETGGNPLLITEIIRSLIDSPNDAQKLSETGKLPLPKTIQAILQKRLNRLDKNERDILLCAAVLGNTFSLDTLSKISAARFTVDIDIIDNLIQSGFIRPLYVDVAHQSNLQFVHEKLREVILKEATPARLQLLHRQTAEILAAEPQAMTEAAMIAHHFIASKDLQKAFHWLLKAAEHNWALGAKEEANTAYMRAETLYQEAPKAAFSLEDAFELYKHYSEFAYQSNQIDLMEKIGVKLQYLGEEVHNPLLIGFSQMALANACFLRFKINDSLELIEKAITNLERTDDRYSLMHAILRQSNYYWWTHQYDKTITAARNALTLANSIQEDSQEKRTHIFYANHLIGMSYYAKGEAKIALDFVNEINYNTSLKLNSFDNIRASLLFTHVSFLAGKYSDCEYYASRGMELTRVQENPYIHDIFLVFYSKIKFITGQLDEAFALANKALKSGEKIGNIHIIVKANSMIGEIYQVLQNHTQSLNYYRIAQIRSGFMQSSHHDLQNDINLSRLLIQIGRLSESKETINHVLKMTQQLEMKQLYSQALCVSGLCNFFENQQALAEEKFANAAEVAKTHGLKHELILCKLTQGQVALAKGQFDLTEALTREILEESQKLGSVWLTLDGLTLSAQLHKALGQPFPQSHQSLRKLTLDSIQQHTQSDDLKKDFPKARQSWEK